VPSTPSGGDTALWAYEAGKREKRRRRERECERIESIVNRKKTKTKTQSEWKEGGSIRWIGSSVEENEKESWS
jgi:hypothetical protein